MTGFADTITKGCPDGDACEECDHCIASWHTKPATRFVTNKSTGLKETVIMRYRDVCNCAVQLSPPTDPGEVS